MVPELEFGVWAGVWCLGTQPCGAANHDTCVVRCSSPPNVWKLRAVITDSEYHFQLTLENYYSMYSHPCFSKQLLMNSDHATGFTMLTRIKGDCTSRKNLKKTSVAMASRVLPSGVSLDVLR